MKISLSLLFLIATNIIIYSQPYLEWENNFTGTNPVGNDIGNVVTVDNDANVYVGGKTARAANYDYITIKYSPEGDTLWTRTYNGIGNGDDEIHAIEVDAIGNVYVTGGSEGSGTKLNIVTIKYDTNGQILWIDIFNGSLNENDIGLDITIDNFLNVYIAGSAGSEVAGVVLKINSAGIQQWFEYQYNGNKSNKILINSLGEIIVLSGSSSYTGNNYYIYQLNPSNGSIIMTYNNNYWNKDKGLPKKIVLDGLDNMYVLSDYNTDYGQHTDRVYFAKFTHGISDETWSVPTDYDYSNAWIKGIDMKIDLSGNVYYLLDYFNLKHFYIVSKAEFDVGIYSINFIIVSNHESNFECNSLHLNYKSLPDIFITGNTVTQQGNIFLSKFSNDGDSSWINIYDCGNAKLDKSNSSWLNECENLFITGFSSCNNTGQDIKTIKYSTLPKPVISASISNPVCHGDTMILYTDTCSTCSFLWSTGDTTDSIIIVADTSSYFTVEKTDADGCNVFSEPYELIVLPLLTPLVVISDSSDTICFGDMVTFTATPTNGGTNPIYQWYVNSVLQNGDSLATLSLMPSLNANVHCVLTTSEQCYTYLTATSNSQLVIVNPLPVASITPLGSTTFCEGDSVTLISSMASTYLWNNGSVNDSINVSQTGDYTVLITDSNGCTDQSGPIHVTAYSLPQPTISANGPTMFCEGGSVILTSTEFDSYLWSNGFTSQSIEIDTSGIFAVSVSDDNGCVGVSTSVEVIVNTAPTVEIINQGNQGFCAGETITLSSSVTANLYIWSTGESTHDIIVQEAGDYTLTITDANGCSSMAIPITITVFDPPIAILDTIGSTEFCEGEMMSLSVNDASSYVWSNGSTTQSIDILTPDDYWVTITDDNGCIDVSTITSIQVFTLPEALIVPEGSTSICNGEELTLTASGGQTYMWNTGATTSAIVVTESGDYVVTVSDVNSCSDVSDTSQVIVHNLPEVIIESDTPDNIICEGQSLVLIAIGGEFYFWNTDESTAAIEILEAGDYQVTITDENGCTNVSESVHVTVLENVIPEIEITTLELSACEGQEVVFTAFSTNGGQFPAYEWYINNVLQPDSTDVLIISTLQNGDKIKCLLTSSDPCTDFPTAISNIVTIAVNPLVDPVINIQQIDPLISECEEAGIETIIENEGNNPIYKWYVNGLLSGNQQVFTSSDFQPGDQVYCQMASNAKCRSIDEVNSNTLTLDVETLPQPMLAMVEDTIYSINYIDNSKFEFSWYQDESQISDQPFVLCQDYGTGSYYLIIRLNDCTLTSASLNVGSCYTGVSFGILESKIEIYPNPNNGFIYIKSNEITGVDMNLEISDLLGRKVYHTSIGVINGNVSKEIDIRDLQSGVYVVRVTVGKEKAYYKIVKM